MICRFKLLIMDSTVQPTIVIRTKIRCEDTHLLIPIEANSSEAMCFSANENSSSDSILVGGATTR